MQTPVQGNPVVSIPATGLNMGIDLWNPSARTGSMKMQPNHSGVSQTVVPPPMMADQWVQVFKKKLFAGLSSSFISFC